MHIAQSTICLVTLIMTTMAALAAETRDGPDKDPRMVALLEDARLLITSKNPAAAIAKCDAIINTYKEYYRGNKQKIFGARSPEEGLHLMLKAAADGTSAMAVSSTWSDAYFMKAYALLEMHRLSEARTTLEQALDMSPFNAQYLAEMGHIYVREKNWSKAQQLYREAEEYAALSPQVSRIDDLARARRGLGYVLVELGRLDEAEAKYLQCLADNPDDASAKAELQYVREQKAKRNTQ